MKHAKQGFRAAGWALSAGLIALVLSTGEMRAEDAALTRLVQIQGETLFGQSGAVGMVLAVVRGENTAVLGFGETTKGNGVKPNGKTVLRIGSISKAMTGQLLADLTATGRVGLVDPIGKYLPPGRSAPEFQGRSLTLLDLATHTATFPRDLEIADAPDVKGNPYPVYATTAAYLDYLKAYRIPYPPGRVASYSNYGFGLLGYLLGRAADKSYGDLLAERLAGPLGMSDTVVTVRDDQKSRLMTGYNADNTPAEPWDGSEMMQGSGGVSSSADDMARWIRFNLAPSGPHAPAAALSQAIYHSRQSLDAVIALDGEPPLFGLGLGWETNFASDRSLLVQKTGGFSGFLSYVVFVPGRNIGAFVAVNRLDLPAFLKLMEGVNGLLSSLAPR